MELPHYDYRNDGDYHYDGEDHQGRLTSEKWMNPPPFRSFCSFNFPMPDVPYDGDGGDVDDGSL